MVGYVFAINGKLNSAEIYPSNGLFRKMWPKLVQASITEAIGQKNSGGEPTPSGDAAQAFLDAAAKGKSSEKPLAAQVHSDARLRQVAVLRDAATERQLGAPQLSGEVRVALPTAGNVSAVGSIA